MPSETPKWASEIVFQQPARGTVGKAAPVAAEFGKRLNQAYPGWSTQYPNLKTVINHLGERIDSWSLDRVWGAIDNRAKLRDIVNGHLTRQPSRFRRVKACHKQWDAWDVAGVELRRVVTRVYCGVARDRNLVKNFNSQGWTLRDELEKLQPNDCVVSFNYDLLTETVLRQIGRRFDLAKSESDITKVRRKKILFCKPHGSLDWKQTVPEEIAKVKLQGKPIPEKDIGCYGDFNVQPGIVPPVPFKEQIISPESQSSVRNSYELLVTQWRCVTKRLSEADEMIVMGYGFPPEDLYGRYLFTEAAARRDPDKKLKVELYEKKDRVGVVVRYIYEIFNPVAHRLSIEWQGPVKRPHQRLMADDNY